VQYSKISISIKNNYWERSLTEPPLFSLPVCNYGIIVTQKASSKYKEPKGA